jgi:hypothetical protein
MLKQKQKITKESNPSNQSYCRTALPTDRPIRAHLNRARDADPTNQMHRPSANPTKPLSPHCRRVADGPCAW